nr:zinc finger, CCHC-type [Tanacetum cinerariifolium]
MAAAAMKYMALNSVKLDKFEGVDFRIWQKKMHFLLSSMSVVYVLTTPIPDDCDDATVKQLRKRAKWDNDDYVELWGSLKAKYKAEDASSKNFLVSNFTIYKMTDSRPVMKQYNELLGILGRKEELTLVELGSHLRIKKSLKVQDNDKPKGNNVDEALDKFKMFTTEVELQQGSLIKRFRTDIGGLSQGLWGEAMLTAFYLLNNVPIKRKMIIPCKFWTKRKPNLNYLRVWGCMVVVKLFDPKLKTLSERGIECIFVGYAEHSKAFRFYIIKPNESVLVNSIIESRDAIFEENRFSSVPRPSLRIPNGTKDIGGSVVPQEVTEEVDQTNEFLSLRFSMKNMGEADVILVSTSMDTCKQLMPNNGQAVSQLEYSRVIGCRMYAMTCTRPDIAFVVSKLSRYTSNPATAGKEAEWLRHLILKILLWSKPIGPISIRCDIAATLAKAYSQMYNGKSRHLGVRYSMIRELIPNGVVFIEFVRSQQNLADHLTKGLTRGLVLKSAEGMGLKSN